MSAAYRRFRRWPQARYSGKELILNSFFSSLGRMLIYATLLPGIVGFILALVIFPELRISTFGSYHAIILSLGFGFLANTIGHFSDDLIRRLRHDDTAYELLAPILPRTNPENIQMIRQDVEYLESLRAWYWNSATIILIIIFIRVFVIKLRWGLCLYQWTVFVAAALCVPFLYILAYWLRRGAKQIVSKFCANMR